MAALLHHLVPAMLVIFRFVGLMIYGPLFGSTAVPLRIKIFLPILLGLAIYPALPSSTASINLFQAGILTLVAIVALELLLGFIIGFLASMPLLAAQTGGLIMGQQMGLGFAQFFNPAIDDEADVLGQIFFLSTLAGFLIIGGHEAIVLAVMHSFEHVPIGGFAPGMGTIDLLTGVLTASFELALRVAAPLLALIFLETVAMGFLSKTVPQLNILSLGFPIRIIAGLAIIISGLFIIQEVLMEGIDAGLVIVFEWIAADK